MRELGYIVSKNQIRELRGFVKLVDDISKADLSKPTLIVGLDNAKNNISNFSILKKQISDKLFWTFKKTEQRTDCEKDLLYFYRYIISNILNNIKYYYINIININYNKLKKLINILYSVDKKYIYINNEMLYLLHDGYIMGISLKIAKYIGINTEKWLNKLYSNPNNIICKDENKCIKAVKSEIGNNKYAIPYFMSLLNGARKE